jgi:uncharacterized protein
VLGVFVQVRDGATGEIPADRDHCLGHIGVNVGHMPHDGHSTVENVQKLASVDAIEAKIGKPSSIVLQKTTRTLDEGCRSALAHASLAGFGFRDENGIPRTTFVGGTPGFVDVESATRLSFEAPAPMRDSGASMVFLVPGVGESLRLNGSVADVTDTRVTLELTESWVHCARCVLRSKLWDETPAITVPRETEAFLASSPFVVVSSWDAEGNGDTSPKGDLPGFIRVLDEHTVAIPDRRGNKRADTFRNLVTCDQISMAALIPGSGDVLQLSGTAYPTDDPGLLATMAIKDKPPHAALVVHIEHTSIERNEAVATSRTAHRSEAPDLMKIAAGHLAQNQNRAMAPMARVLTSVPKLTRRMMDASYRKALKDEGY